jgi:hypothetical protein
VRLRLAVPAIGALGSTAALVLARRAGLDAAANSWQPFVLVTGLLREKLWAYPASFAVFGAFIAYQLYRYSFTHDVALIFLSIFDLFVIGLAVHEYRLLRKHLPTH